MAIVHTEQRRPYTIQEDGDTEALPSRLYNRLAHNVNNIISFACRPTLLMQHWPGAVAIAGTAGENTVGETAERTLSRFYREIRFVAGAVQTVGNGVGTANVTLRLRVYSVLFNGNFDRNLAFGSVTINAGAGNGHRHYAGFVSLANTRRTEIYLVVTAEANNGSAAANLFTLKAWGRVVP